MQLMCLNKEFECIGYLQYINLQWTRRYFDTGEFSAMIRTEDYDENVKYLYTSERPEMGMVEKIHTEQDITGHYVQISGRFLEGLLSRNVVWPKYEGTGRPSEIAYHLVRTYAADIPRFEILAYSGDDTEDETDAEYEGETIEDCTWSLLQLAEKSQRITYDFETGNLIYSIWQGTDRTQSQEKNNYAFFSDVALNTEKIAIDEDESGYRNMFIVKKDDNKALIVDLRESDDEEKRWMYLDESGSDDLSDSALRLKAREAAAEWPVIRNVEATTIQHGMFYLQDYDLGDLCDVVSNEMRRSYETRITEVREVFKDGQHGVEIVFGDKIPTFYERMMNR